MLKIKLFLQTYKSPMLVLLILVVFFGLSYIGVVKYGSIKVEKDKFVTVTGNSQTQKTNEIATFNAGVEVINADKSIAVSQVNEKSQKIADAVKEFGVDEKDIKTTNMTVYQEQDAYWENGVQKFKPGQWRANVTVEVTLRDIEKASRLSDLLAKQDTTNIYGPNFALDNLKSDDATLLASALTDAQRKAAVLAQSGGKKLGELISVVEGTDYNPSQPIMYDAKGMGGGGGSSLEPGSTTVVKTVTATYKLN